MAQLRPLQPVGDGVNKRSFRSQGSMVAEPSKANFKRVEGAAIFEKWTKTEGF